MSEAPARCAYCWRELSPDTRARFCSPPCARADARHDEPTGSAKAEHCPGQITLDLETP